MKTEHYKNLEQKYFAGETTPEEERFLKENGDDFFKALKEEKAEKMDWDFDDFLAEIEEKPIIPISGERKSGGLSMPKIFWMAASLALIFGAVFGYQYFNKKSVAEQNNMVASEIQKQKSQFQQESQLAVNQLNDSVKAVADTLVADSTSTKETYTSDANVLDKILPRRGRMKKTVRQRYTYNEPTNNNRTTKTSNPEYQDNYVIINGHRIENEQEAIDVAKFSLQMLSNKVSETVAKAEPINDFTE